jgi:hypothetical protein
MTYPRPVAGETGSGEPARSSLSIIDRSVAEFCITISLLITAATVARIPAKYQMSSRLHVIPDHGVGAGVAENAKGQWKSVCKPLHAQNSRPVFGQAAALRLFSQWPTVGAIRWHR